MNKEARYIIRLANESGYLPADHERLLKEVRAHARPLGAQAMNLRVSRTALEFDLFCRPDQPIEPIAAALHPLGRTLTHKRLDGPPPPVVPEKIVEEARALFNQERYWEVHEVLEGLWKELKGKEKQLVQGLILAAAAGVHVQKDQGKVVGPMLTDAARRLQDQPAHYYGWDIAEFLKSIGTSIAQKKFIFPTV